MRGLVLIPVLASACTLFPNEDESLDIFDDWWGDEGEFASPELAARGGVLVQEGGAWASTTGTAPGEASAWLGMGYVVCEAEYTTGYFTNDTSPEDGSESDVTDFDDDTVIAMSNSSVTWIDRFSARTQTERVPRVRQAKLYNGGLITLQSDRDDLTCTADDGDARWVVPFEGCRHPAASDVTPEGEVWVVTDDGTTQSSPEGEVEHPAQGDRIAIDPERKVIYVARSAPGELDAWTPEGTLLWTTSLGGSILDLQANVARGSVSALIIGVGSERQLVELAWDTGARTDLLSTDTRVSSFAISPSGDWFSVADDGQVYFLTTP